MVNDMVNIMLEIRKNGCVVCKCEFECVGLRSESIDSLN